MGRSDMIVQMILAYDKVFLVRRKGFKDLYISC